MYRLLPYLLALLLLGSTSSHAQAIGGLGTLTAGPYVSNAQGLLTGPYQATLPTTVSYQNFSAQPQDSLLLTAQVLGNGYVQGLEHYVGRKDPLAPTAQATYPLGDITLPGPGSYLVQVAGFAYNRQTQKWQNGPVRVYWLFPLAQPLPVELTKLSAAAIRDSATVVWETASELRASHFVVERSTNGSIFEQRAILYAHGTSAQAHRYRYTERQLRVRTYYRLCQVDSDGGVQYSPVVALDPTWQALAVAQVYPNPAREQAQLTAPAGVVVSFYDEAGRKRRQQTLGDNGTLYLSGLPPGSYHLTIGEGPKATHTRLNIF